MVDQHRMVSLPAVSLAGPIGIRVKPVGGYGRGSCDLQSCAHRNHSAVVFHSSDRGPTSRFSTENPLPVLSCVAGFTLGVVAFRLQSTPSGNTVAGSPWVGNALVVAIGVCFLLPGTDIVLVALTPILVIHLARSTSLASTLLSWQPVHYLGLISYSLYLIHFPIIAIFRTSFAEYVGYGIASCLAIVASVLVAPIVFHYAEVPSRRALRRLPSAAAFVRQRRT